MALTLQRPTPRHERPVPHALHAVVAVTTGPVGVLVAACALTAAFLTAVANLVTRLG